MAYVRNVAVVAVFAVFLQSGHSFHLSIPDFFGGSLTVDSTTATNNVGGSITVDGDTVTKHIEFGPAGGIQTRMVSPMVTDINRMISEFQTNVQTTSNNVGNLFKDPFSMFRDPLNTIKNGIDDQLKKFGFNIPEAETADPQSWDNMFVQIMHDIDTGKYDIQDLINNAGGLMSDAMAEQEIAWAEAASVVSAIISSALQERKNPISTLIDVLEEAVDNEILTHSEAVKLLARATQAGLHQTLEDPTSALDSFFEAAVEVELISDDAGDILRALLNPGPVPVARLQLETAGIYAPVAGESAALDPSSFPSIDALSESALENFK